MHPPDTHASAAATGFRGGGRGRKGPASTQLFTQVVALREQGLDNSAIALRLSISRRTVVNYCKQAGLGRSPGIASEYR